VLELAGFGKVGFGLGFLILTVDRMQRVNNVIDISRVHVTMKRVSERHNSKCGGYPSNRYRCRFFFIFKMVAVNRLGFLKDLTFNGR